VFGKASSFATSVFTRLTQRKNNMGRLVV